MGLIVISDFTFITSAEKSDVGLCRKNNEDSIISLPEFGVYCVADGMGGVKDGEVASQAVVDTLEESFVTGTDSVYAVTAAASAKIVALALNKASKWIENRSQEKGVQGSGSTAIAMVFDKVMPGRAIIVHAGDSRAYCFRNKKLIQLSSDHSVAAEAGIKDENDLPPMLRGVITRAIGLQAVVEVEFTPVEVKAGDIFFLCSDGLSRMVSDKKISSILKKNLKNGNQEIVDELIGSALKAGGKDNVSVVLMRIAEKLPEGPMMAIPEETLRLEAMELPKAGEIPETDDEGSITGETVMNPFHSDDGMMECSTPGSDSGDDDFVTPVESPQRGAAEDVSRESSAKHKSSFVMLIIGAVVVIALAAVAIWFYKNNA